MLFTIHLLYSFFKNQHAGLENTQQIRVVFCQALLASIFYFEFLQLFNPTWILESGQ